MLIIIDHGEQYYSLIGGLGKITKKVGEWVKKAKLLDRPAIMSVCSARDCTWNPPFHHPGRSA